MAQTVKPLSTMQETWVQSLDGEDLLEKEMVGYSPWGQKESDRTERLHFHFLSVIGLAKTFFWVFL